MFVAKVLQLSQLCGFGAHTRTIQARHVGSGVFVSRCGLEREVPGQEMHLFRDGRECWLLTNLSWAVA